MKYCLIELQTFNCNPKFENLLCHDLLMFKNLIIVLTGK